MSIERFYELSEEADKILKNREDNREILPILMDMKQILVNYKHGSVGLGQLNPVVGDLEYNSRKIMKYISYAENLDLDLVVFPEYSLVGYPISAIFDRYPFLIEESMKWLGEIAKFTASTVAVVGFAERGADDDMSNNKYNSCLAIMYDGKIQKIIRTSNLEIINISDIKYAFYLGGKSDSYKLLEDELKLSEQFDIFVDCSILPMQAKKTAEPEDILKCLSKKYGFSVISLNLCGVTDNIVFDGQSAVYDCEGSLIARAESFKEQFFIVNPFKKLCKIYDSVNSSGRVLEASKSFSFDYDYDLERIYKAVINGIRDYFGKNGLERACLGLSGGLDSTVCAVLLTDALGAENVFGISMPSKITTKESKSDAQILAKNLGINYIEVPIKEIFDTTSNIFDDMFKTVEVRWNCRYEKSYTNDNIQARARATYLWGIANEFSKCIPIATSDKSEVYMGYATINGDMSGGFAPIADITKTKLFALARWLNKNRTTKNVIPESIILRRPGAELAIDEKTGKPLAAEDALMPYEFMDEVIWRIENLNENYDDMLDSRFLYEDKYELSKAKKVEWLDKFYRRMASASYKKSILPPSITLDSRLNSSVEIYYPISSNVNFKRISVEDIDVILKDVIIPN